MVRQPSWDIGGSVTQKEFGTADLVHLDSSWNLVKVCRNAIILVLYKTQ